MPSIIFHQQQTAVRRDRPPALAFDPTADQIAAACPGADPSSIAGNWPLVRDALVAAGWGDAATFMAAVGNIYVETSSFRPIREYGDVAYFTANYENNASVAGQLGNSQPGDGARYCGRGYIQITGRANYRTYGRILGVPLEDQPDLALDAGVAAKVLAAYFVGRSIPQKAQAALASANQDWTPVRYAVNAGLLGYDRFFSAVQSLKRLYDAGARSSPSLGGAAGR
jgi:hypothetical protein